jgi:protein ImuA
MKYKSRENPASTARNPQAHAEVATLSMTASRRLQLAAEGSGATASPYAVGADRQRPPTSDSRQRPSPAGASALPSTPLPVPGVGRARWQLELIRCRAGESANFVVEAGGAKGRLALPSNLVHGSGQKEIGQRRVAG